MYKAFEEKSKALKAKDALIAELQGNLKQKEMENDVSGSLLYLTLSSIYTWSENSRLKSEAKDGGN